MFRLILVSAVLLVVGFVWYSAAAYIRNMEEVKNSTKPKTGPKESDSNQPI